MMDGRMIEEGGVSNSQREDFQPRRREEKKKSTTEYTEYTERESADHPLR